MNAETIAILIFFAIAFYGQWLLDIVIREIRVQHAHYH